HDHGRWAAVAARTSRDLHDEREGVLSRAIVREMERQVRIDDAHARHGGQVETACDELRADEDVGSALAERLPDLKVRVGSTRHIAVEAQYARLRPDLLDHALEALRPHPPAADVAAAAVRARRWHRGRVAAVVAHQAFDFGMLHE